MRREVLQQLGHVGPILPEPLFLFVVTGRAAERTFADVGEAMQGSLPRNRKAPNLQRLRAATTRRILVAPGDVILAHDVRMVTSCPRREMLGDVATVRFRSAGDVRAEAVNDAGQLHRGEWAGLAGRLCQLPSSLPRRSRRDPRHPGAPAEVGHSLSPVPRCTQTARCSCAAAAGSSRASIRRATASAAAARGA